MRNQDTPHCRQKVVHRELMQCHAKPMFLYKIPAHFSSGQKEDKPLSTRGRISPRLENKGAIGASFRTAGSVARSHASQAVVAGRPETHLA